VTALRRYLLGLTSVAALGIIVVALAGPPLRNEIAAGATIGLLLQAPLGWWTLRSIGTEKFQLVWLGGMVIRLAVVALTALVLSADRRWDAGAVLMALVATLLVLLLVEAATAVQEHSRSKSR
jgi:heme A synthase